MNEVCGAIYLADSFKKIREVPDHSIDVILTDPPYNLGQYSTGNLKLSWRADFNNDIAAWDMQTFNPAVWVSEFQRILKPTGNLFAFTSYNLLGPWHSAFDPVFDQAAVDYVRGYRFEPTLLNGVAVRIAMIVDVPFAVSSVLNTTCSWDLARTMRATVLPR